MEIFTVSFFGHKQISQPFFIEKELDSLICDLLLSKEYVEFLVGRTGEFDQLAASTVRRCRHRIRDDNSALILVLPYITAEYRNNEKSFCEYYDTVELCKNAAGKHFKAAYQLRNRAIVDRSDLVVFCVEHDFGGAYQTMQYAKRVAANQINLANQTTINP